MGGTPTRKIPAHRASPRSAVFAAMAISALTVLGACDRSAAPSAPLTIKTFAGEPRALAPVSVLIVGQNEIVLVDGQWLRSDANKVADMIEAEGKTLTAVLLTHGHPDHYFGLGAIRERFPEARILARQGVIDEIVQQFPAKRVHWEEFFPGEIPVQPVVPELLEGDHMTLEGHEIRFVDLPLHETAVSTAFYLPSARTLIAGDLIFSKSHFYMADTNNADAWIVAIGMARALGPIDTVIAGHGPAGGPELFDEAVRWMNDWKEIAKPGVRINEIATTMRARYPQYDNAIMLWLTRGPGFGLGGAREIGVPPELLGPPPAETAPADGAE